MKKTAIFSNLTFIVEDDAITVYDHTKRPEPRPEDKYVITPERKGKLLKAIFDAIVKAHMRNDEVYYILTFIVENPTLILMPSARVRAISGEKTE
jgi:hypothetical protein